jgi:hypothetical protein
MIYTYMGPKERMPLLPAVPWISLAEEHVQVRRKCINDCNWLQTQEGNVDSVHTAFLHSRRGRSPQEARNQNNPPSYDAEVTSWGVRGLVRYPADDNSALLRTNTFLMPVYALLPNGAMAGDKLDGFQVNVEVPMDDATTMRFTIDVQRTQAVKDTSRYQPPSANSADVGPDGRKLRNLGNDYLIDRTKQRSGEVFSGLDCSFLVQDACAVESMGTICDRENEHLGITDTQVATVRRFLLDTILKVQEGADAPGVAFTAANNDFSDLYQVSAVVPTDRDWKTLVPEVTTQELAGVR